MRIVQTVFGVFHHFALARELDRRGHLQRLYSTWPWARLKREGLPHSLIQTYPWFHMAELAASRAHLPSLADRLGYANALAFDRWTMRRLQQLPQPPDALIAISGSSLLTGQWLQQHGGVFICDRGSTHQRFQQDILSQEFALWGVSRPVSDPRDTAREEAIYAQADAITVPSSIALRSFLQMGVPAAKLHLIPYGVQLRDFHPTSSPDPQTFDALFAGAAGLRKGVPYLLQAFANLQHPHKTLRIAGSIQPDLRDILARLPTANVEFLGPIPRTQLVDLMSRSHALVLPSVEDGFGLVLSEAMACGCPPIASTNTGAEDLFTDGVEGFIVPIRDPAAITGRLQQLADSPALQQQMRAAALARVQSLGGWADYGDRWQTLLHTLTGK
jgi:glycosyltransferase involved in cell wall biosynthesis